MNHRPEREVIVLFDGECLLCNRAVQFILPRDRSGLIRFASLQSAAAMTLLAPHGCSGERMNSLVLLEGGRLYTKSDAVLRIARRLTGGWPLLAVLQLIPAALRDAVYDWIARNRYRWFGKQERCMFPQPQWENRFLDSQQKKEGP